MNIMEEFAGESPACEYPKICICTGDTTYWREVPLEDIDIIRKIVSRTKVTAKVAPIKELVLDELQYVAETKDEEVGLYEREWRFIVETLEQKASAKGTRNKERISDLAYDLSKYIKKEMK